MIHKRPLIAIESRCYSGDICDGNAECIDERCKCAPNMFIDDDGYCQPMRRDVISSSTDSIMSSPIVTSAPRSYLTVYTTSTTEFTTDTTLDDDDNRSAIGSATSKHRKPATIISYTVDELSSIIQQKPIIPSTSTSRLQLGEHCRLHDQCPDNADCIFSLCMCLPGYINNGGVCIKGTVLCHLSSKLLFKVTTIQQIVDSIVILAPGNRCTPTDVCGNGSICDRTICKCPLHTILIDGRCVLSKCK